jgi:hypothetical protein
MSDGNHAVGGTARSLQDLLHSIYDRDLTVWAK